MSGGRVKDVSDEFMVEDATRECGQAATGTAPFVLAAADDRLPPPPRTAAGAPPRPLRRAALYHLPPTPVAPRSFGRTQAAFRGAARNRPAPAGAAPEAARPRQEHAWVPALPPGRAQVRRLAVGMQAALSGQQAVGVLQAAFFQIFRPLDLPQPTKPARAGICPHCLQGAAQQEDRSHDA